MAGVCSRCFNSLQIFEKMNKQLSYGDVLGAMKTLHGIGAVMPNGQISRGAALMSAANNPSKTIEVNKALSVVDRAQSIGGFLDVLKTIGVALFRGLTGDVGTAQSYCPPQVPPNPLNYLVAGGAGILLGYLIFKKK